MDERSQWFGLLPRGVPSVLSILPRGYRMGGQQFILDRSLSGKTSFDEIFINRGQYVMTCQFFPNEFYQTLLISNLGEMELKLKEFSISPIKSIW
tara:strand:- start:7235 stop:7519 length:285 start_codon:yes stop_codon:yes gene_type:complete